MGYAARDTSARADAQRAAGREAQIMQRRRRAEPRPGHRQDVGRVLVQTDFPVEREHAGRKTVRKLARLWVRP